MDQRLTQPWLAQANYPLDWNGPGARAFAPFGAELLERPIIELFAAQARLRGASTALDDGARRLSFAETLERVAGLAARLAARTRPGDLVGVLLPASVDFSIAMLACLATGRLFVPLDLHYPRAWIADVLASAGIAAVIADFGGEAADLVPSGITRIGIAAAKDGPAVCEFTPAGPDDPAIVIFTSGSTGKPKGIVNSQRAMLRRVEQHVNAGHLGPDDRFMPLSSGCTIAGLRERLSALVTGAALCCLDVQCSGAREILWRLEETGTTVIYAVPALLRTLIALDAKGPSRLRVVRVGGDAVLWSDVSLFRGWLPKDCLIQLGYSSTEAPIFQWFVSEEFPRDGVRIPIGYPLNSGEVAILGEDGEPVAAGEVGELVVKSPYVALGHWRDGKLDSSPFPQAPEDPSCRILRTGDLVSLRSDGLLDIIGRKDRMVKIRGIRIEPGEVEAALRAQPGVADAAVLPRRIGNSVSLIGYVVARDGVPDDLAAFLKCALKPVLPAHMQPQRIYAICEIPRLPSAKLDVKGLEVLDRVHQADEAQTLTEAADDASAEAASAVEATVSEIWKRLLGRAHIDRNADFFDLGGDSLMTLNMMFALEEELGVDLPVTMIFEAPTIATLAAAIETQASPTASLLVKIRDGDGTPLFIVHGVGGNVMELFGVGRRLEHAGPVYAIQAKGLDGHTAPNRSIAAMADDYLAAIHAAFPDGGVHLAGYSSGGLVAFEMARRLAQAGKPALSLTLIDTQTNSRQWPWRVWLDVMHRRVRHHRATMRGFSLSARLGYFLSLNRGLRRRLAWRFGLDNSARPVDVPARVPAALQDVYQATLAAIAAYKPGFYDRPMTVIVAAEGHPAMAAPAKIWPAHAPALTIRTVPGDHFSMIQGENATALAETLSEVLAHATACEPPT